MGVGSRHMYYLANVPGHEHFLAKDPPPGISTIWLMFQGMQSKTKVFFRAIFLDLFLIIFVRAF